MTNKIDRERMAIELKQWLRSQGRYRTIRELEGPAGIPYSSLKDYFSGAAIPKGDRLERLTALTGVPSLLSVRPDAPSGSTAAGGLTGEQTAREVLMTLHRLVNELHYFKRGTAADRATLRRVVPARDVGYATTLLKAMYDEDQFQTWVYFADYSPEAR